jgi:predicted porin
MNKKLVWAVAAALAGGAPLASAAGLEGITFNGFLTAGMTKADQSILPGTKAVSQDGNVEDEYGFTADSRLGIQLTAKVNSEVTVTGQLLARADDQDGSTLRTDWAYVSYRFGEPASLRAGKVKLPTFLVSDYIEVGYAYPWIRPPQEVYSANPISTINGADLLLRARFGRATLLVQPYFGVSRGEQTLVPQEFIALGIVPGNTADCTTIPGSCTINPAQSGDVVYAEFTADRLAGINLSYGSDLFTVRAGYLTTKVNSAAFQVSGDEATFWSVGATVDWKNVVFYSEYFEREIDGVANLGFPNQKGYYGTLGYRFGKWLPHVTFAKLDDNDNPTTPPPGFPVSGTPLKQSSVTAGLRVELGSGAALKIEAQQIRPEEGSRGLLIADPRTSPVDARDSVNVYSIAVDVVF